MKEHYNYYDDWRTEQFVCPACKWSGPGSALAQGATFSELYELNCPACHGDITIISYPTTEEAQANRDKFTVKESLQVAAPKPDLLPDLGLHYQSWDAPKTCATIFMACNLTT